MCLALGATRTRLAAGIAIEGALLALAGAAAALPVAVWLFAGAREFQLPGGVPIELLDLTLDARTIGLSAAAALLATLLISLIAGAFSFSANLSDALRSRSGATARAGRRRTRAVLVAAQVAVALVLLAGAGLFARSLVEALRVNPGFDAARLLTTGVNLFQNNYSPERADQFFDGLDRLGQQMGAQQFGASVLGALGVIAVLLTVLGTYVLAESMAVLRMREMGIRAALGATRSQLAAIVLAETGRLVGLGLVAGLLAAWLSRGLIESFLFRVEPFDATTLGLVASTILGLALLVSVRPALRAARVDLGGVLKEE